ncbi:MAG TPA: branched-chain amino acid ABC transporter permease LivH [Alphaproteobacteria bacterium]|nr:branched-chain amino acid ABC transporter permease LivH [Alphaproteobacteria bacterium]
MAYFLQQLINGLTLGAIYGLIAIGYTMVYGVIGMINFAHGELYMIGAFVGLIGILALGSIGIVAVPVVLLLALLLATVTAGLYGWAVERLVYRPLRSAPRLAPLISAIGLSITLQQYVQLTQGGRVKTLAPMISGEITLMRDASGFAVSLSLLQIVVFVLTILLMTALTLVIRGTDLGRAQRAAASDPVMAALCGIDVDRTISTTFIIGAALAAVAGVMVVLYYGVIDFFIGFLAGLKAFTAAVLGGIGSIPGALLGGLFLGLVESLWAGYADAAYKDVGAYAILMLVLIIRPSGILGRPEIEKV